MKKKVFLLGISALLLCGCGKIPTLSNGDEAVVTFKDGNMISANDFYNEIKDTMGLDTLISMIDKYVFEHEFKDELENAKTYASASIKQLRSNYESDEEMLSALRYYGMFYQTVEAYENYVYLSYLQNHAIETYVASKITEEELKDYYANDVYPNVTLSHILVTPEVEEDATDSEKEDAEKKAKETINNIIKKLNDAKKAGKNITDEFKALADEYSSDDNVDLGEINLGSFSSNYDELVKAASTLKDGEYSTEVITTELGYHVILKTKTGEKESYDDALETMKDKITQDKLAKDSSLMIEAIRHYRDKYELDIIDSEMDSQYSKYMNNLINAYKSSN